MFDYMTGRIDAATLHVSWQDADLLPQGADWASALAVLDRGSDFGRGARWGLYNIQRVYLDLIEALVVCLQNNRLLRE